MGASKASVTTVGPAWKPPLPYGYAEAVTMAGSVAAPLLAGFTITLLGIVIGDAKDTRWPGIAMILLTAAAAALLLAVQAAFTARSWQVSPTELKDWAQDQTDRTLTDLAAIQDNHKKKYDSWSALFRFTYNVGLVLLLLGVATCLAPPPHDHVVARVIAAAIMGTAALGEVIWSFVNR